MMSQHPTEPDPRFADEPTGVVATEYDDRIDVYGPAGVASNRPAPSAEVLRNGEPTGRPDPSGDTVSQVKDSTKEAGQRVADVAKDQAGNVAAEATSQAKDLLSQGREQVRQQAAEQQTRVAGGLRSVSRELRSMADGSTEQGMAAELAREASDRVRSAASWLEAREPGQLLEEVRSFARERPGAFLALAAGAGVLAGRLGRGLKEGEPQQARHLADPTSRPTDPIVGQY